MENKMIIVTVDNEIGGDNNTKIFTKFSDVLNHAQQNKGENISYIFIPYVDFDLLFSLYEQLNDAECNLVDNINKVIVEYVQDTPNHSVILNL